MNDFPENELNRTDPEPQRLIVPEHDDFDDEFASVFGDPEELKRTKAVNGTKKRIGITVLSCVLVAALVVGVFAVKKYIKPLKKDAEKFSQPTALMTRSADNFTEVTVKNENGTFRFVSHKETAEKTDETTGEAKTEETVAWSLAGENTVLADGEKIAEIVTAISAIQVNGTVENAPELGLEKPRCTVTVKDSVNGDFTLKIGTQAFDYCYLDYSANAKIYKAVAEDVDAFFFTTEDLAVSAENFADE